MIGVIIFIILLIIFIEVVEGQQYLTYKIKYDIIKYKIQETMPIHLRMMTARKGDKIYGKKLCKYSCTHRILKH